MSGRGRRIQRRKPRRRINWFLVAALAAVVFAIAVWPLPGALREWRAGRVEARVGTLVERLIAGNDDASVAAAEELAKYKDAQGLRSIIVTYEECSTSDPARMAARVESVWQRTGPSAVPALISFVNGKIPSPARLNSARRAWEREVLAEEAARALVVIGKQSIDPLIDSLANGDVTAKRKAAWALGRIGDEKAVDTLILRLGDSDPAVAAAAVRALGGVGNTAAMQALTSQFQYGAGALQGWAALALACCDTSHPSMDYLTAAAANADATVRCEAATALASEKDAHAFDLLLKLLSDAEPGVRASTAGALASHGDARAIRPLVFAFRDRDTAVRQAAESALDRLRPRSEAVDYLVSELGGKDSEARRSAAMCLGILKSETAVDALIGTSGDSDEVVRIAAIAALGDIQSLKAVDIFLTELHYEEGAVFRTTVEALGKIGDTRATDALIDALQDVRRQKDDPLLRDTAITALRNLNSEKARKAVWDAMHEK